MRILLDEQLPRQLAGVFTGHEAYTVQQQGWAGLTNGELLRRAEGAGFDVFLTADQSMEYQQNLRGSGLFVVVVAARSNNLEDLLPIMPSVLAEIEDSEPGRLVRVSSEAG